MRTKQIEISYTLNFPCDAPDENNVVYTHEAILKALEKAPEKLPVCFRSNQDNEPQIIGYTTSKPYAIQYMKHFVQFTVDCVVFFGGTECIVNEIIDGNKVANFEITLIGFSN